MTETGGLDGRAEPTGTGLTLDLRHPNCRAIEATGDGDGGVLAHAVYTAPESEAATGTVTGLFTAYGESSDEVDALLERVRASALARGFFLEYDPGEMVCPALLEHLRKAEAKLLGEDDPGVRRRSARSSGQSDGRP